MNTRWHPAPGRWRLQPSAWRGRALGLLGLPLLVACATPAAWDNGPPAVEVPAAWVAAAASPAGAATDLRAWWSRFDDPLLGTLIGQALYANTDVAAAQAALRQAWAASDVAAAALRPRLDAAASAQRSRSGGNAAVDGFRVGLDASWDADLSGANRLALDAGRAAALASGATLGDVQVSAAAAVALTYVTLRGNQARLQLATDNLAGQQETLQLTLWRVQAGLLSALEGEQARAAAEQTGAQLPALRAAIEQGMHALAVLTGRPPATLFAQLSAARPLALPAAADLVPALPAETLRRRADVRAAELRVRAAWARVAGADAARQPSLRLGGNLGLSALTLGGLSGGAALASGVLASLALPLVDGGAAQAQVGVQRAALEQAGVAYRAVVLAALKDVEDALVALRSDGQRLERLRAAAEAAAAAALLARQRYGSGLVDFQVVLETQRTQRSAQDAVVDATTGLGADHVRLFTALGGGLASEDAIPPR